MRKALMLDWTVVQLLAYGLGSICFLAGTLIGLALHLAKAQM